MLTVAAVVGLILSGPLFFSPVQADVGEALIPLVIRGDESAQRYRDVIRRIGSVLESATAQDSEQAKEAAEELSKDDGREAGSFDQLELEAAVRDLQTLHEEIWGLNHMMYDAGSLERAHEDYVVAVSLTELIIDTITSLPTPAVRFYREEYSLSAQTLLKRGLAQRDAASLMRTAQLYPLIKSAPQAILAAGDIWFEDGQFGRASESWDWLERILRSKETEAYGIQSSVEELAVRRAMLAGQVGDAELRRDAARDLATFEREIPPAGVPVPPTLTGGLPQLPFTLGRLSWRTFPYWRENQIMPHYTRGGPVHYSPVPVFGDGWMSVPTSRKVLRFNVDSGKQVGEISLSPEPGFDEEERLIEFYAVTEGDYLVTSYVADRTDHEQFMGFDITVEVPKRGLKGIRVGTDRVIWDTVRRQTQDPFLAELSFNSSLVLSSGRLYALGWRKKGYIDVFLVCLDVRNGKRLWSAPIVGNQVELTMFGEAAHEPILGDVIVENETVYCSTNLGVVARVRGSDGHVLWATEYEAPRKRAYRGRRRNPRRPVWERNNMQLAADRLVVTPLDSPELFVLDPRDGRVLQSRMGLDGYLVGVWNDFLVLAKSDISLIPLRDVERGVSERFRAQQGIRARPALVEGGLVYSTDDGLFYQPLVRSPSAPGKAVKLCSLRGLQREINDDPIQDGIVTVLPDRIIVTSAQISSCFIQDTPKQEVRRNR